MNPGTKKWLTGCGIGCGALVLLGILGTVGGSFFMMRSFSNAIDTREDLDARHGDQGSYTPPLDGAIAADRLEAFLTVRSAIMVLCDDFANTAEQFQQMDTMEEDTPKTEVFVEVAKLSREIIGMVPRMGRFFQARNGTLAEVDMGLGEYTYIYTMVYSQQIRSRNTAADALFGDEAVNDRLHVILRDMLERQLTAVEEAEADGRDVGELRDVLRAEIELLTDDPARLPWQDGAPPALADSIAPWRDRLDAGFCPLTVGLELNKNRQQGLSIHGD